MRLLGGTVQIIALFIGLLCGEVRAQGSYGFREQTNLNWDRFSQLLLDSGATSVEETLPVIKSQHPEFFDHFVLMYRSKSLQQASFQAPRAILFDLSGQFVFSFNGERGQRGYQAIEIMSFNTDQKKWEFREVLFSEKAPPKVSEPNPAKCLQCHQSSARANVDPRPNWEPYNIWPGAYGSDSGSIRDGHSGTFAQGLVDQNGSDKIMLEEQAQELIELTKFFTQTKPDHPRYKYLGFDELSEIATRESGSEKISFKYRLALSEMAHETVKFTQFLASLNAERVIRLMTETEAWTALKYAMISSFRCGSWQLETNLINQLIEAAPKQFIARDSTRIDHSKTDFEFEARQFSPEMHLTLEEQEAFVKESVRQRKVWLAGLADPRSFSLSERIFLLFEGHGIDIEDWSMDFKTEGRFAFYERFGTPSNTGTAFIDAARKLLPKEDWNLSCEVLRVQANQQIRQYRQQSDHFQSWLNKPSQDESNPAMLLDSCIQCHDHTQGGKDLSIPKIFFRDSAWLSANLNEPLWPGSQATLLEEISYRLSDHATLDEQMPPINRRPSLAERRALIEYFKGLAQN